ncbi:MAG: DnaJ domain-containing protein [Nitrospirota bacterium]
MGSEKRKYRRYLKRLMVRFGISREEHTGFTEDLAYQGVFIRSPHVLPKGAQVVMEVTLPDHRVVRLNGHVRWSKRVPLSIFGYSRKAGMGVELEFSPAEYVELLTQIDPDAVELLLTDSRSATPVESLPIVETQPHAAEGSSAQAVNAADISVGAQEIISAYEVLESQNHYEVLRVDTDATPEIIKRAYYRAAKIYHPDRHASMPELKDKLDTLFVRLNEAYHVLSSEERRQRYNFDLAQRRIGRSGDTNSSPAGPEHQAHLGRRAFEEGRCEAAIHHFELAVHAAPHKGVYHSLLARALHKIPKRQRDAETHYKRAIELEPARVENYLGLGQLYKQLGLVKRATQLFETALAWDPGNQQAQREVQSLASNQSNRR